MFLKNRSQFSAAALETLVRHTWPGNVRELKNAVERGFILADAAVGLELLPIQQGGDSDGSSADGGVRMRCGTTLAQAERSLIEVTLSHCQGNKTRAAQTLGCSLKTLYNKLALYHREPHGEQMEAVG